MVILTTDAQLVSAYTVGLSVMERMIVGIIPMKELVSNNFVSFCIHLSNLHNVGKYFGYILFCFLNLIFFK